jgi:anti-anti-sigma factor
MPGLDTHLLGDLLIVNFAERKILDQQTVVEVETSLSEIAAAFSPSKILVDLHKVQLMTSTMIAELVKFQVRCGKNGKQVVFCSAGQELRELISITRLDKLMHFDDTREQAFKTLKHEGPTFSAPGPRWPQ